MYWLDLQDIILMIKCLKDPQDTINIKEYIQFVNSNYTRAGKKPKNVSQIHKTKCYKKFLFFLG